MNVFNYDYTYHSPLSSCILKLFRCELTSTYTSQPTREPTHIPSLSLPLQNRVLENQNTYIFYHFYQIVIMNLLEVLLG